MRSLTKLLLVGGLLIATISAVISLSVVIKHAVDVNDVCGNVVSGEAYIQDDEIRKKVCGRLGYSK